MIDPASTAGAALPACHECGRPADDSCVRCELPTCADHFHEQEHLGICTHCGNEVLATLARGGALVAWPYPLRKPFDSGPA